MPGVAKRKAIPKSDLKGLPPVPEQLIRVRDELHELRARINALTGFFTENESLLESHLKESTRLKSEEESHLLELAAAESMGGGDKDIREALDSIRGRIMLAEKHASEITAAQTARANAIEEMSKKEHQLKAQLDQQLGQYRRQAFQDKFDELQKAVETPLIELLAWIHGPAKQGMRLDSGRWILKQAAPGIDADQRYARRGAQLIHSINTHALAEDLKDE